MGLIENGKVEDQHESNNFNKTNGYLHGDDEKQERKRLHSGSSNSEEMFESLEEIIHDPEAVKRKKRKIMKNLLLICVAFLCNFTAFGGTSSLQSSLNYEEGLGTASLSVVYGSLIISAMFTPSLIIKFLGCKWTICCCIIGYITYSLANFYPHWGTLMPSSVIVGLSAAPLWSAKCSYLTTAAKQYAYLSKEKPDTVMNRFFGIFFFAFQLNNIIGQLISSFVLSSGNANDLVFPTCYNSGFIEGYCGAHDCQADLNITRRMFNSSECPITDLQSGKPPSSLIYTLMGIYSAVALFGAILVGLFVDPIQIRLKETRGYFDLLIATFSHMKDYRQLLLIIITMYSGFEQAFLTGDLTRSFITCPLAVNWVGFVLICYGVCDALFSYLFGKAEKFTGRPPLFTLAFFINLSLIIVFLTWIPYPSTPVFFFLFAALWGVADAVWQTQLNAFYGILFISNQEASFANYRLFESLGFVIAFAYQNYICVNVKLYVLLAVLLVGISLYYYVEYDRRKKRKKEDTPPSEEIAEKVPIPNDAYLNSNQSVFKDRVTTI